MLLPVCSSGDRYAPSLATPIIVWRCFVRRIHSQSISSIIEDIRAIYVLSFVRKETDIMRNLVRGAAALFLAAGTGAAAAPPPTPAARTLSGEYVEARTCNVYTGACHANGEMVTAGREAVLAWQIKQGTVEGVKVDGLNA